jgi:serine/threonine protein phosphatase 1
MDALLMGRGRMGDLPDDVTLVHGHYIVTEPVITPRRLSIDTGAYRTGLLTAVRLSGNDAPEVVTVTAE